MDIEKYDVVILGGGNAGMGVTVATRAAGLKASHRSQRASAPQAKCVYT
jgi:succinate dehydrogenase/fumarate reductase flavoprotein subunit